MRCGSHSMGSQAKGITRKGTSTNHAGGVGHLDTRLPRRNRPLNARCDSGAIDVCGQPAHHTGGCAAIIIPVYKEGKTVDDLDALPYVEVEQRLNERESEAVVVWNTHALVCLASTTENIHVIPPAEYHDGSLTLDPSRHPKGGVVVRQTQQGVPRTG